VWGHWLGLNAGVAGPSGAISSVTDNVNGAWTKDAACPNTNGDIENEIWRYTGSLPANAGALTVTVNFGTPDKANITFADIAGLATSGARDTVGACHQGSSQFPSTGVITPGTVGDFLWGGISQVNSLLVSINPSNPTFSTMAGGSTPLEVPLYVLQNQFATAQATISVSGGSNDFAGQLTAYKVCPGNSNNAYIPLAY
jgi:hypothetical protein